MPIVIKSAREIELMRVAGRITAGARIIARQGIAAGVTTKELDREIHRPSSTTAASRPARVSP